MFGAIPIGPTLGSDPIEAECTGSSQSGPRLPMGPGELLAHLQSSHKSLQWGSSWSHEGKASQCLPCAAIVRGVAEQKGDPIGLPQSKEVSMLQDFSVAKCIVSLQEQNLECRVAQIPFTWNFLENA